MKSAVLLAPFLLPITTHAYPLIKPAGVSPFSCSLDGLGASTSLFYKSNGEQQKQQFQQKQFQRRRNFLKSSAASLALPLISDWLRPSPALAFGGDIKKINGKLSAYGLPQMGGEWVQIINIDTYCDTYCDTY